LLWSVLFAVSSLVLWARGLPLGPSVVVAALLAAGGLLTSALILAVAGQLGVGGTF
jgi:hypothetical protein